MKKIFLLISLFFPLYASAEGIGSAQDLIRYISALNNGAPTTGWESRGGVVRLTADIDLSKEKRMPSVEVPFEGKFDGAGHRLSGWKAAGPLFRMIGVSGEVSAVVIDGSCSMRLSTKNEPLSLGFIAGINNGTIRDCENFAPIVQTCKYTAKSIYIGGIAGVNNNIVMNCRNHGAISAEASSEQTLKTLLMCVGGIVGAENKDVSRTASVAFCENTGAVSSKSDFISHNIGGVVGATGRQSVKLCVNRGAVTGVCVYNEFAKLMPQTKVGGIVGMAKNSIWSCDNYGDVSTLGSYEGFSAGIVAAPMERILVADCNNYGKIEAKNESRAYRGGIAGNVGRPAHFKRCYNRAGDGSGVLGNIYKKKGAAESATFRDCKELTGVADGYTEAAGVRVNGDNVFGTVTSVDGNPIPGVVVSDGHRSVQTDSRGQYSMKSDLSECKFVTISVPSGYELPRDGVFPTFYRRIDRNGSAARADFKLSRSASSSSHTVAIVGAPEVTANEDFSMEAWQHNVAPDVAASGKAAMGQFACIVLGSVSNGDACAYDEWGDAIAALNAPAFCAIGAGDYDDRTILYDRLGRIGFETYLNPVNFSFNVGDFHYVILNSIRYDRLSSNERYRTGLGQETVEWLEGDLKYVPSSKVVVLCSGMPVFSRDAELPGWANLILDKFDKVYAWSSSGGPNTTFTKAGGRIVCTEVSRCCGTSGLDRKIGVDGTPQGYVLISASGRTPVWHFKTVGKKSGEQIRAYSPLRSGDGFLKACIWAWDESWGTPQWYENGNCVGEMTYSPEADLEYQKIYAEMTDPKMKARFRPSTQAKMFRIKPTEGSTGGEIRVKDRFGVEYRHQINW